MQEFMAGRFKKDVINTAALPISKIYRPKVLFTSCCGNDLNNIDNYVCTVSLFHTLRDLKWNFVQQHISSICSR